jgi:hypothetical protein
MLGVASGRSVHGHKLLERLGGGLYGEVWRAEHLGRPVALKLFTPGRRLAHVRREVLAQDALGKLDGPDARWFPRVEEVALDADPPFVRMELVEGSTLEELLANPVLTLEDRLGLGEQVLAALDAVHRHGFVHGDLSPLNVLVTPSREVKLIDVGFGAIVEDPGDIEVSASGEDRLDAGVASPLYSAPERFRTGGLEGCGKPADLFSFGKLLYRLITGEQPFVIKPVSLKYRALGEAWDGFLFRCLEERPEARFADGAEALAAFRRIRRPELAPGEYRAECPECRAAQSIPGGWAGERFDCRGCAAKLEVLFYDDASRYATTAVATGEPPILFLESEVEFLPEVAARARKFCVACGGEIKVEAKKCRHCGVWADEEAKRIVEAARRLERPAPAPRSLVAAVFLSLFGYLLFWVPGVVLNAYFLEEARRIRRRTGREPAGTGALRVVLWTLCVVPLILLGSLLVLGLTGAVIVSLLA